MVCRATLQNKCTRCGRQLTLACGELRTRRITRDAVGITSKTPGECCATVLIRKLATRATWRAVTTCANAVPLGCRDVRKGQQHWLCDVDHSGMHTSSSTIDVVHMAACVTLAHDFDDDRCTLTGRCHCWLGKCV